MTNIELPDGEYIAVIDNVEDGLATVFFERHGEEQGNTVLEATKLPSDAQHADAVLSVTVSGGEIEDFSYKPKETSNRAEAAQDRFDQLSKRPPSEEDK